MVMASILFNPGMSKMREQEKQRAKKSSPCRPLGAAPELQPPLRPGARDSFIPGGMSEAWRGQGRAWVLRAAGEPAEKAPGFA